MIFLLPLYYIYNLLPNNLDSKLTHNKHSPISIEKV